jgi:glutathione S-transferase
MASPDIVLHGGERSGHTHRVVLLLNVLALPYRFVPAPPEVRRTDAFLKLNPLGQIPVLQDGPVVLADSSAIMVYLVKRYATGSTWLPDDPIGASHVQRWLSIAAGELRYGPAMARLMALWGAPGDRAQVDAISTRVLKFMNAHLEQRSFLALEHPTIADLACYAYAAHAPEGGLSLSPYPAVQAWLRRIEQLPKFTAMPASPPL